MPRDVVLREDSPPATVQRAPVPLSGEKASPAIWNLLVSSPAVPEQTNGRHRRVITKTTTEQYVVDDHATGFASPPRQRTSDETAASRALRLALMAGSVLIAIGCVTGAHDMAADGELGKTWGLASAAFLCLLGALWLWRQGE